MGHIEDMIKSLVVNHFYWAKYCQILRIFYWAKYCQNFENFFGHAIRYKIYVTIQLRFLQFKKIYIKISRGCVIDSKQTKILCKI